MREHVFEPSSTGRDRCIALSHGLSGVSCGRPEADPAHVPVLIAQTFTMPTQPDGARWARTADASGDGEIFWTLNEHGLWVNAERDEVLPWVELLLQYGAVTVLPDPPREPRRWAKLDAVPDDLRVVKVNGKVWRREVFATARWACGEDRASFSQLRASGEVVEVFE